MLKYISKRKTKASNEGQNKKVGIKENWSPDYDMLENLRNSTTKFVSESRKVCDTNKNRAIHKTIIGLSKNKNIRCLNTDKEKVIVVLNTN